MGNVTIGDRSSGLAYIYNVPHLTQGAKNVLR